MQALDPAGLFEPPFAVIWGHVDTGYRQVRGAAGGAKMVRYSSRSRQGDVGEVLLETVTQALASLPYVAEAAIQTGDEVDGIAGVAGDVLEDWVLVLTVGVRYRENDGSTKTHYTVGALTGKEARGPSEEVVGDTEHFALIQPDGGPGVTLRSPEGCDQAVSGIEVISGGTKVSETEKLSEQDGSEHVGRVVGVRR